MKMIVVSQSLFNTHNCMFFPLGNMCFLILLSCYVNRRMNPNGTVIHIRYLKMIEHNVKLHLNALICSVTV